MILIKNYLSHTMDTLDSRTTLLQYNILGRKSRWGIEANTHRKFYNNFVGIEKPRRKCLILIFTLNVSCLSVYIIYTLCDHIDMTNMSAIELRLFAKIIYVHIQFFHIHCGCYNNNFILFVFAHEAWPFYNNKFQE